jgi:hypothetical protein
VIRPSPPGHPRESRKPSAGGLLGVVTARDPLRVFLRPDAAIKAEISRDVLSRYLGTSLALVQVDVTDGVVRLTGGHGIAQLLRRHGFRLLAASGPTRGTCPTSLLMTLQPCAYLRLSITTFETIPPVRATRLADGAVQGSWSPAAATLVSIAPPPATAAGQGQMTAIARTIASASHCPAERA